MWSEIIQTCESVVNDKNSDNWACMVSELIQKLTPMYEKHYLKRSQAHGQIPYGRYLIHNDPQKRFHIEIHIFSDNYMGEIHCHETWGVFWLISGTLFVEDFLYEKSRAKLARSSFLKNGSACSFHPPESDWHRVRTLQGEKQQTISLHIYGSGYDLKRGKYLNQDHSIMRNERGSFKENALFYPRVGVLS